MALENKKKDFSDWCILNEQTGELEGPHADRFAQAMRLEGTKAAQSKHAAGIVIGDTPLNEICPMVFDTKEKQMVVGLEMEDVESLGLIKYDVLGIAFLDKIDFAKKVLADEL